MSKALLVCACLSGSFAQAATVTFDFAHGADYESSTLSFDGELDQAKKAGETKETTYDWTGSVGRSKVNTQDTAGNQVVDNTTTVSGGLGLETPEHFSFSGDFSYAVTPEQALINSGPGFAFGYTYYFAKAMSAEDGESHGFTPRLNMKINVGQQNYEERFGSETRKGVLGARPTVGKNTIAQRSFGLSLGWKPVELVRFKGSYVSYTYSKDVNEFIQYLDAQPRRAAGLSGAISGFARYDFGVEVDLYFLEAWEIDLSERLSKIASDDSTSKTDKLMVYLDVTEKLRVGLGGQRSASDTGSNTVANEGLFSLAYDF